ncbi:MAG TPA: ComF family protein [Candidatus Sulfotelmatobacter sp.]|jgi:ComF family protein|nr:ComF family protein [Candidatus Sulfotelmatobacter sp.]
MAALSKIIVYAGRRLLDVLIPPRCLKCGGIVDTPGALCPSCWEAVNFITAPLCACCGTPFDIDLGPDTLCVACIEKHPRFHRARSVFRYDDASRALILRFKHADRTGGAKTFARWMARAGAELLAEADVILPVPLHPLRLLKRRYNQAALLGQELAKLSGKPCRIDALARIRNTKPQGTMGRRSRSRNLRGAFAVKKANAVAGKNVLLIDDVLTSGATLSECGKVLSAAGAVRIDVLTLARVVLAQ